MNAADVLRYKRMQTGMPEAGLAAIGVLYAVAHESEYLRSAAIDLMRAGLPAEVVADICGLARICRRECALMECCAGLRYTLNVCNYSTRVAVTIFTDKRIVAKFEFRPGTCALTSGDWCDERAGPLNGTFRDVALTMLAIGAHFVTGWSSESRMFREITEFICDARDPPPEWWAALDDCCRSDTFATIGDTEMVIPGSFCCLPCEVKWENRRYEMWQ